MKSFSNLNLPQQLSTSLLVAAVVVIILNEIERLVQDRCKDRQRQKALLNIIYFMRQISCLILIVLLICLNMFTFNRWE